MKDPKIIKALHAALDEAFPYGSHPAFIIFDTKVKKHEGKTKS
jgi:hypothetical protein